MRMIAKMQTCHQSLPPAMDAQYGSESGGKRDGPSDVTGIRTTTIRNRIMAIVSRVSLVMNFNRIRVSMRRKAVRIGRKLVEKLEAFRLAPARK
mmetsp:Transcript_22871/g.55506  ORF Transcript_22871/g.55506 Transcript_22871/m.55506 type:complete len:94 (+) Transcript_22871:801-1082(+)